MTIFDVGEHEGRPYIVMEYLAGGSLADRLSAQGAQPLGRSLAWLDQAAAALDAAHAHGVVHRDVKPANLLLDQEGTFTSRLRRRERRRARLVHRGGNGARHRGLPRAGAGARRARDGRERHLRARRRRLRAADRKPAVRARLATAEAAAHVSAPIPSASAANPDLPPELDAVFARGLAKDPAQRQGSAAELVGDLRAALDSAAGSTVVGMAPTHEVPSGRPHGVDTGRAETRTASAPAQPLSVRARGPRPARARGHRGRVRRRARR